MVQFDIVLCRSRKENRDRGTRAIADWKSDGQGKKERRRGGARAPVVPNTYVPGSWYLVPERLSPTSNVPGKLQRCTNTALAPNYIAFVASEPACLCLSASEGRASVFLSASRMRQAGARRQVSDVERFVSHRVHLARIRNNQVRLRRISAFLPQASWGVSSGGTL